MIKLIVGLGNPGSGLENSRHNIGFMVIDNLSSRVFDPNTILFKPQTGMNNTGGVIKEMLTKSSIQINEMLVIHDDLAFPEGDIRLHKNKGSGSHNGIQNIIDTLDSKDFYRLRVGIGPDPGGDLRYDYVLGELPNKQLIIKATDYLLTNLPS